MRKSKAKKSNKKYAFKIKSVNKPTSNSLDLDQFEVVVLATMSAGKSTIINALVGTELLPSSNQACTARVFKIEDHDGMEGFQAAVINSKTGQLSSWVNATPDSLKQLNDLAEKGTILIQGDIKSIFNQGMILAIYDTPGPNNSQDDSHGKITKEILNDGNFGLILYALNATQLGVEDDAKLLQDLYDLIQSDLHHKEIVFVVNKADQLDEELGECLDDVVKKVETYLARFGFKSPTVLPLSSISALLARKKLNNEDLSSKEKRSFKELSAHVEDITEPLYMHSNLPTAIKSLLKENFKPQSNEERMIAYSGITAIEHLLQQRLSYAKKDLVIKTSKNKIKLEVTVLATMSAGKSTLVNAMVGKELLPSKNVVCTATIARVINEDTMAEFMFRRKGVEGQVIDDWQAMKEEEQHKIIEEWNEDLATSVVEIKGNLPAIKTLNGVQMVLVDTPNLNYSNNYEHSKSIFEAVHSSQPSMVIYVLNATQLGVTDDQSLLNLIKDAMSKGGHEAHDRFIFVANKVDTLDPDMETVASVVKNVKTYLGNNGIVNPLVIPVSAELTKLIRVQKFYGKDALSRKQTRTMNGLIEHFVEEEEMNLLEQVREDLPRAVYQNLKKQVDEAKEQDNEVRLAELLSGVPILEEMIDRYISNNVN